MKGSSEFGGVFWKGIGCSLDEKRLKVFHVVSTMGKMAFDLGNF